MTISSPFFGSFINLRSGTGVEANVAPAITSDGGGATAAVNAAENQTAVTTVTATDANMGDTLTFSISGGADAALFAIGSSSGILTFLSAPDFEVPTDANTDGVYEVEVTVTDDGTPNLSDAQAISVTVTDVAEGEASFGSVVALLPMAADFGDDSLYGVVESTINSPVITGAKGDFTPANSALSLGRSPKWAPNAGSYTIEMRYTPNANDTELGVITTTPTTGGTKGFKLFKLAAGNFLRFVIGTGATFDRITGGTALASGTEYHIACVIDRTAAEIRLYVDGVSDATPVAIVNTASVDETLLWLARELTDNTTQFHANGFIRDLRITKGVIRYTANFTPPAAGSLPTSGGTHAVYGYDGFVDADTTLLTSHTSDSGHTWTEPINTGVNATRVGFAANNGTATTGIDGNNASVANILSPTPGGADYAVELGVFHSADADDDVAALVLRYVDVDNFYVARIRRTLANPDVLITKRVAGVNANVVTANVAPIANNTWAGVRFECEGTTLRVKVNGVEVASGIDGDLTAAGKAGFGWGGVGGSVTDDVENAITFDGFIVEKLGT